MVATSFGGRLRIVTVFSQAYYGITYDVVNLLFGEEATYIDVFH